MGRVLAVPFGSTFGGSLDADCPASPPARRIDLTCRPAGFQAGRNGEAGEPARAAALLCHPFSGGWRGYPYGPGAARSCRREHHHDRYAGLEPAWTCRSQPLGLSRGGFPKPPSRRFPQSGHGASVQRFSGVNPRNPWMTRGRLIPGPDTPVDEIRDGGPGDFR